LMTFLKSHPTDYSHRPLTGVIVCPVFLQIHPQKIFRFSLWCHPLNGVTRGSPPSPPGSLGDATDIMSSSCDKLARLQ